MKTTTRAQGGVIIIFTFIISLSLTIVPLPGWGELLRPEWIAMVLIYWCMALPNRVGVGYGWVIGLFLDVARDALLGQHALALAVLAYVTLATHQRIRNYPLGQQAIFIFLLMTSYYLVIMWIRGISSQAPAIWEVLLPALMTALIWPFLFPAMRFIRRHYQVS